MSVATYCVIRSGELRDRSNQYIDILWEIEMMWGQTKSIQSSCGHIKGHILKMGQHIIRRTSKTISACWPANLTRCPRSSCLTLPQGHRTTKSIAFLVFSHELNVIEYCLEFAFFASILFWNPCTFCIFFVQQKLKRGLCTDGAICEMEIHLGWENVSSDISKVHKSLFADCSPR